MAVAVEERSGIQTAEEALEGLLAIHGGIDPQSIAKLIARHELASEITDVRYPRELNREIPDFRWKQEESQGVSVPNVELLDTKREILLELKQMADAQVEDTPRDNFKEYITGKRVQSFVDYALGLDLDITHRNHGWQLQQEVLTGNFRGDPIEVTQDSIIKTIKGGGDKTVVTYTSQTHQDPARAEKIFTAVSPLLSAVNRMARVRMHKRPQSQVQRPS